MKSILGSISRTAAILLALLIAVTPFLGQIGAASYAEEEREYQFGSAEVYSTADKDMLKDSFYYSDDWFSEDPSVQNDELALLSMQLAGAALDDKEDGSGAEFLKKLGFSDIGSYGFATEDPDDCAYLYGTRKAGGDTIIAVVIQSYALDQATKMKGWMQNFKVNGETAEGEHEGLSKAAESVLGKVAGIADGAGGNVKYWITGHSRGGAIADLLSAKLPSELSKTGKSAAVYGYTFEAPAVVDEDFVDDQAKYSYIHNYLSSDDIVTMVPPADWGMTLYGVKHDLKTEETDAKVNEELENLGSSARMTEESGLGQYNAEYILVKLLSRIPEREDYTRQKTDTFTTAGGEKKTVAYTPQGTFLKLMEVMFGDDPISTEGLADRLEEAIPALDAYLRAYLVECGRLDGTEEEMNAYYYKAAEELCGFLKPSDGTLPFNEEEAYAILKLAAPVLIDEAACDEDTTYAVTDEQITLDAVFVYAIPALTIALNTGELVFSHQFDTSYARLKVLAPAPEFGGINLTITEPQAGDAVSKAPRAVEKAVDDLGLEWMDVSAKWETEDPLLKNNKVQYLNVIYYIKGHSAFDSTKFAINGENPVDVRTSVKDGITAVRCAFQYTIGDPAMREINFGVDAGAAPDPIKLPEGTLLKYVEYPELEPLEGYLFKGWYDLEEGDWEEMAVANTDLYFSARQVKVIDRIEVSFTVPAVGSEWKMPSVPKNAPYHLQEAAVEDGLYNMVDKVQNKTMHTLSFNVVPNSEKFAFKEENEEFAGDLIINGAVLDYSTMDFEHKIFASSKFTPKDNRVTALQKGGDYKMADKVIRGSKSNASLKGSSKSPLKLKAAKRTKKSIKLSWKKAKGTKKYVVYGALKGKKFTKITTLKKTSFTVKKAGKKLVKGKKYKFIVVAVGSGSKVISTSKTVAAATRK